MGTRNEGDDYSVQEPKVERTRHELELPGNPLWIAEWPELEMISSGDVRPAAHPIVPRSFFWNVIGLAVLVGMVSCSAESIPVQPLQSAGHPFEVQTVASGLSHPWGLAFLPDGDILVTERPGRLRRVRAGELLAEPISGLPEIQEYGQGGLLGIALHPRFASNGWIYLSYAGQEEGAHGTEVVRGRLEGSGIQDLRIIFRALPKSTGGNHFGSRLVFGADGTLFVSLGDRGNRSLAQELSHHPGSLIRVKDDGSVPADNPFIGRAGARSEIYAYGNRNMQGMALNPFSGETWSHEHGPQGGDEVNIMRAGANYGWPVITYGVNYGTGSKIGEGTHRQGMEQPIHTWVPSIAPSGMAFYTGNEFPDWKGDLFVGSLKFGLLVRLDVEDNRILGEERLLDGDHGRIRDVVQGPDGFLYLLTDESDGRLLRLVPAS